MITAEDREIRGRAIGASDAVWLPNPPPRPPSPPLSRAQREKVRAEIFRLFGVRLDLGLGR